MFRWGEPSLAPVWGVREPKQNRVVGCSSEPRHGMRLLGTMTKPCERTEISAEEPDWSREAVGRLAWDPARQLLGAVRAFQACAGRDDAGSRAQRLWAVAQHRFWSVVSGAEIPLDTRIGGGLLIPHPNGIVIHPDARLGPNCLLFQQVTIGNGSRPGVPVLGGHVDVGAGAKLLGGIRIGDHATIGANAVVVDDVPHGATVVGVPARVVARRPR